MAKINYHGGCQECDSQEIYGKRRCNGCQYRVPNWGLPNLSTAEEHAILPDPMTLEELIEKIPQMPRVQYDTQRQMRELSAIADKFGLDDASDYLQHALDRN